MVSQKARSMFRILSFSCAWMVQGKKLQSYQVPSWDLWKLDERQKVVRAESPLQCSEEKPTSSSCSEGLTLWPPSLRLGCSALPSVVSFHNKSHFCLDDSSASGAWAHMNLIQYRSQMLTTYLNSVCLALSPGPLFQSTHPARPNLKS